MTEGPIELSLRSARRSFRVAEIDARGKRKAVETSEEQDAVLNILLSKVREKDSLGRVVLARASMKRKPE